MARVAVDDGIRTVACTPHNTPGLYENTGALIAAAVHRLTHALAEADVPLRLAAGCDIHMRPDFATAIRSGLLLTLNRSRYALVEPPRYVAPPALDAFLYDLRAAGVTPVFTHPERLSWIEGHYDVVVRLARSGIVMQITAGSLTGQFGRRPRYWAERMLSEGLVHVIATDAHDLRARRPVLSTARDAAAGRVGTAEAENLVVHRPAAILSDAPPAALAPLPENTPAPRNAGTARAGAGLLTRLRRFRPQAIETTRSSG